MMLSLRAVIGPLAGALLLMSGPAFANVVFTDSTFDLANYTASPVFTSGGATLAYDQCASCGNPGLALQLIVTFAVSGGTQTAGVGLANTTFSYDPLTQGAILSINASVDKNLTDNYPFGGTFGNTFRPLIEQDGNFYLAAIAGPGGTPPSSTGYNTIAQSGLVATGFEEYDFTTGSFVAAFPNFAGDPMLFGLAQIFSSDATTVIYTSEADYDNLRLTIVNTVPEPGSIFLLGAGILGLVGLRRRARA